MKALRVEIDRLDVTLDGFPSAKAEGAIAGVERELHSALERVLWVDASGPPDAAVLRAAIVEQLMDAIREAAEPEAA
jgi:hypothetical protein